MYKRTLRLFALLGAVMSCQFALGENAAVQEKPQSNRDWWPQQLDLSPLRQHALESNPYGADFNYTQEFKTRDLATVKKDIAAVLMWWMRARAKCSTTGSGSLAPAFRSPSLRRPRSYARSSMVLRDN